VRASTTGAPAACMHACMLSHPHDCMLLSTRDAPAASCHTNNRDAPVPTSSRGRGGAAGAVGDRSEATPAPASRDERAMIAERGRDCGGEGRAGPSAEGRARAGGGGAGGGGACGPGVGRGGAEHQNAPCRRATGGNASSKPRCVRGTGWLLVAAVIVGRGWGGGVAAQGAAGKTCGWNYNNLHWDLSPLVKSRPQVPP